MAAPRPEAPPVTMADAPSMSTHCPFVWWGGTLPGRYAPLIVHVRATFVAAAEAARELLSKPEVAERWDELSVLPVFKVSGLAGHLARAIFQVETYLESSTPGLPPIDAPTYFAQFGDASDITSSMNMSVRERGEAAAERGPERLTALVRLRLQTVRALLATEPEDRRIPVFGGDVMLLDEYLKTRLVELVVHTEDLALSVGTGVGLPADAITIATDVVVATARRRHGDLAVLRGMTRRERDDVDATRVF